MRLSSVFEAGAFVLIQLDILFAANPCCRQTTGNEEGTHQQETSYGNERGKLAALIIVWASLATGPYQGVRDSTTMQRLNSAQLFQLGVMYSRLLLNQQVHDLTHDNLVRFMGICPDEPNLVTVTELCTRGSLRVRTEDMSVAHSSPYFERTSRLSMAVTQKNTLYT